jgi:hypothetical protein
VRPDREYQARLLAHSILEGDSPAERFSSMHDSVHPTVNIELRGMVTAMRREFHLAGAEMAEKVAAELQRQLGEVDIDKTIGEAVAKHIAAERKRLDETALRVVKQWVEGAVSSLLSERYDSVRETAKWFADQALKKAIAP